MHGETQIDCLDAYKLNLKDNKVDCMRYPIYHSNELPSLVFQNNISLCVDLELTLPFKM